MQATKDDITKYIQDEQTEGFKICDLTDECQLPREIINLDCCYIENDEKKCLSLVTSDDVHVFHDNMQPNYTLRVN